MTRPLSNPWSITPYLIMFIMLFSFMAMMLLYHNSIMLLEFPLVSPSPSIPSLTLILDPMSCIFLTIVSLISLCVYNFSKGYMLNEPYLNRFSTIVLLFILSMYILISIPNMITLLLGWDGLGLTSFLLIIYYQNPKSLGAGMFTFLTNRLGDALIIIAIAMTLNMGHWNLMLLWYDPSSYYMCAILMLGAITKSAQIPFSSWLPAAMAAPTPVSALVHSSTLVTAGIYLLIRFFPLMSSSNYVMKSLLFLSSITTLMAGLAALFETDMKKIIALSTLSQLGIMMMSLSLNSPTMAYFHLITHATFKALLFISAGTLIHTFMNTQDLRLLGNIASEMPLTAAAMNTANIALCGLPFLSGFYSKDQIIELAMSESASWWVFLLTGVSTALTASYSFRLSFHLMWSSSRTSPMISKTDNNNSIYTTPMIVMSFAAIITGASMNWLYILPLYSSPIPISLKLFPLIITMIGITLTTPKMLKHLSKPKISKLNIPNTLMTMWFLTHLSTQAIARPVVKLNSQIIMTLDHGWNEFIGPQGLFSYLKFQTQKLTYMSTLSVSSMILMFLLLMLSLLLLF